jgi:ribosomal protein S18 acetylase RimI-like enzyme
MLYYNLRLATPPNAALLTKLSADTFYHAFAAQNTPGNMKAYMDEAFTVEKMKNELEDSQNTFFIAFSGEKAVGYAKLQRGYQPASLPAPKAIQIHRIYVLPEMIGQQVGRRLMNQCLAVAEQEQFNTVWLGVWEKNPRAIQFYQKYGFEIFDSYTFTLGDEDQRDFLMKKSLG